MAYFGWNLLIPREFWTPRLAPETKAWKVEEGDDDVTIAKLHDTVGSTLE